MTTLGKPMQRLPRQRLWRAIGCGFVSLMVSAGALAQRDDHRQFDPKANTTGSRTPVSGLQEENSNRVGASPQQIKAVLVKAEGLLVELKRWVSDEATANGQVIDDADLTDQAIFDRLEQDVVFRSVATRLLQRFGYLLPIANPDSNLGKESELMLKERARRIVQIEAQEDATSIHPVDGGKPRESLERVDDCDEGRREYCGDVSKNPRNSQDRPAPQARPAPPSRDLLEADEPVAASSILRASSSYEDGRPTVRNLRDTLEVSRPAEGAGLRDRLNRAAYEESDQPAFDPNRTVTEMLPSTMNSENSATRRTENSVSFKHKQRFDHAASDAMEGPIVHKPSPYGDIPALYDMYVQIPSRDRPVARFGVDILSNGLRDAAAIPMDLPVGPDYVVGPGDSLAIDLWGGISQRMLRVVDRQGRIALPEAGPILVSGRTIGEVQLAVQQELRSQYRDTSADVSLSRLRTIRVYVVGEVAEPGAYDISSLSTPLNALVAAGGITPYGSLRALKHYRGKQLIEVVDAYDLLLRGVSSDAKRLENGDSLLVPSVGSQVTIEGMVRRPAIYELHGEGNLRDALELAGGVLPAAALQHVEVERLIAHQKRTMFSLDLSHEDGDESNNGKLQSFQVQDGDRIHIFPIAPYNEQAIYLQGHVLRPGRYSYHDGMRLNDLVNSYSDLLPEPAASYAEIIRLNPPDFHPTVESFNLADALANKETAPKLMPLDTVRIFGRFDFEPAPTVSIDGEVREPGRYATSGQSRFRDAIYLAGGVTEAAAMDSTQLFRTGKDGSLKILSVNLKEALAGDPSGDVLLQPNDHIIVHRNAARVDPPTVYAKGDVAKPGRYPLTSDMRLIDLVQAAGGIKTSADRQNAILIHQSRSPEGNSVQSTENINLAAAMAGEAAADRPLANGDVLTIRRAPGWDDLGASVTVRGEVMHPGTYGIRSGDSLADVLARAGGLAPEAYPYGTVLTRTAVREIELKTHGQLVARVQAEAAQLKSLPENDADQKNAKLSAVAQTETTLAQLEANLPIGRVVIHSPATPKGFEKAASQIPLRGGDVVQIPKKANYVLVNGQVFNATAVSYVREQSAKWYLSQAGGLTQLADKNAVFVIRANGSVLAAKNSGTLWSGDPLNAVLLPGDTIIVPEKAPKIGNRNWTPLIQTAQVATSVVLAVAYFKP